MDNSKIWTEFYRPSKVSECILPKKVEENMLTMIKSGSIPNMIFHGSPGLGKSTLAKALADELGYEYLFINGSIDNGMETLRATMLPFAQSISMNGRKKMIIIDEGDRITASAQDGAKAFIEEYADNVVFIFTCNHPKKIIPAIHSRCSSVDFKIPNSEKPVMAARFSKRIEDILTERGVKYSKEAIAKFLIKYFPDFRRVLMELQRYSNNRNHEIDVGILAVNDTENINKLVSSLKDKDFKSVRSWVTQNSDLDTSAFYRILYENLLDKVIEVPQLILIIADYSFKSGLCADQEINNVAALIEIMGNINFKV